MRRNPCTGEVIVAERALCPAQGRHGGGNSMFVWVVRVLLATAAVVVEWLIAAAPEPRFGVMQGIISAMVFVGVLFLLSGWGWFSRHR